MQIICIHSMPTSYIYWAELKGGNEGLMGDELLITERNDEDTMATV